ncbi:MAG TPA: hypothetical protein EYP60_02940 [bacterium (Candidatus Stahlbacteria)]|nr:hypothetical protein [Candidatus Stahlbacteria bacterium]
MVRSKLLLFSIILLFAAFLLGVFNISNWLEKAKEGIEIRVYIKDGTEVSQLKKQVSNLEGINEVSYISKEMALKEFKKSYAKSSEYLEGLDFNPLPESFRLSLKKGYRTNERIKKLVAKLSFFEGIDDVIYDEETVQRLETIAKYFPYSTLAMGVLLFIISLTMLYSKASLRYILKSNEIRVMRFMGASSLPIRARFILIEFLEGILISGVAILCVYEIYKFLIDQKLPNLSFFPLEYWVGFIVLWTICSIMTSCIVTRQI